MDKDELKELLKEMLREGLTIETKKHYGSYGDSDYNELVVSFDGEVVCSTFLD